jgi:hypothetical protein
VFDNSTTLVPSIVTEAALKHARKKSGISAHSSIFGREAVTFSISVARVWDSTEEEYSPFVTLLRDSISDFGGELLSMSPFEASPPLSPEPGWRGELVINGVFLAGEMPIRQSGGSKSHLDIVDAITHFVAFVHYLLRDESFLESTFV